MDLVFMQHFQLMGKTEGQQQEGPDGSLWPFSIVALNSFTEETLTQSDYPLKASYLEV